MKKSSGDFATPDATATLVPFRQFGEDRLAQIRVLIAANDGLHRYITDDLIQEFHAKTQYAREDNFCQALMKKTLVPPGSFSKTLTLNPRSRNNVMIAAARYYDSNSQTN